MGKQFYLQEFRQEAQYITVHTALFREKDSVPAFIEEAFINYGLGNSPIFLLSQFYDKKFLAVPKIKPTITIIYHLHQSCYI